MTDNYKVLVPTDFTEVAECAMEHAAKIASTYNGEVHLLHIVNKKAEVDKISNKMEAIAGDCTKKYNCKFGTIIRIGNIFDDIGDVATEIGAKMIVMGTHGIKGIQHITGSYALKVITNSKVPFIVVQKEPADSGFKNIVLPVDSSQSSKRKLAITTNMAKHFNSKIHIYAQKETDEFLKKKLTRELNFAKDFLEEKEVQHVVEISDEKGGFTKQLVKYAAHINADLIAIVNETGNNVLPNFFNGAEQSILANEAEIPVMVMNPILGFVPGSIF